MGEINTNEVINYLSNNKEYFYNNFGVHRVGISKAINFFCGIIRVIN